MSPDDPAADGTPPADDSPAEAPGTAHDAPTDRQENGDASSGEPAAAAPRKAAPRTRRATSATGGTTAASKARTAAARTSGTGSTTGRAKASRSSAARSSATEAVVTTPDAAPPAVDSTPAPATGSAAAADAAARADDAVPPKARAAKAATPSAAARKPATRKPAAKRTTTAADAADAAAERPTPRQRTRTAAVDGPAAANGHDAGGAAGGPIETVVPAADAAAEDASSDARTLLLPAVPPTAADSENVHDAHTERLRVVPAPDSVHDAPTARLEMPLHDLDGATAAEPPSSAGTTEPGGGDAAPTTVLPVVARSRSAGALDEEPEARTERTGGDGLRTIADLLAEDDDEADEAGGDVLVDADPGRGPATADEAPVIVGGTATTPRSRTLVEDGRADDERTGDARADDERTDDGSGAPVPVLRIAGLTKRFGSTVAVASLDLDVPAGTFSGIVGPNGAGKTTTLSMVTGLLRPDSGRVSVNGVDVWRDPVRAKASIGVLPDSLRLFDRLTGEQLLFYSGVLRGLDRTTVRGRSRDLVQAFGLEDAAPRLVSDYSAGMTKKIALAAAMIHSPRLLVLDEPFESVDPVSAATIIGILQRYVRDGGSVVLSSHSMDLIERVCDRVAVIVGGRVLAAGTTDEVRDGASLEERFVELAGGRKAAEGLEWLHSSSD